LIPLRASLALVAILAVAACGDGEQPVPPEAAPGELELTGDWRDYFGVMSDALEVDTAQGERVFQCANAVDAERLLAPLWPIWERQLASLPKPAPPEFDAYYHLTQPMYDAILSHDCEPFEGKLDPTGVLATSAVREADVYRNADRWIAFTAKGYEDTFFVKRNVTVD
jgi:hypothetical protein